MNKINEVRIIPFSELSVSLLYQILHLRSEVFVVEQCCPYQDLDYKDQQAQHALILSNEQLIAYARILSFDEKAMSFGRVIVSAKYRRQGLGRELISIVLDYLYTHRPSQPIIILAQQYLEKFYQLYGFISQGEPFVMDGIWHVKMIKCF